MATCRKFAVRKTVETTTTFERTVAVQESERGYPTWMPWKGLELKFGGDAPEPVKEQITTEGILLELSEEEAHDVMEALAAHRSPSARHRVTLQALQEVLSGDKDFCTRR